MAITVKIPTQLRSVTGGESEAQVEDASTVGEVLDGLYERFDGLRERIAVDGDLRRFVNVYVGGEDIRFLDGLDTAVGGGGGGTELPGGGGGASGASVAPGLAGTGLGSRTSVHTPSRPPTLGG